MKRKNSLSFWDSWNKRKKGGNIIAQKQTNDLECIARHAYYPLVTTTNLKTNFIFYVAEEATYPYFQMGMASVGSGATTKRNAIIYFGRLEIMLI